MYWEKWRIFPACIIYTYSCFMFSKIQNTVFFYLGMHSNRSLPIYTTKVKMAGRLWKANRKACGCGPFKVLYKHKPVNADTIHQVNAAVNLSVNSSVRPTAQGRLSKSKKTYSFCGLLVYDTMYSDKWVQKLSWNIMTYLLFGSTAL
jgi:hypothetical protein